MPKIKKKRVRILKSPFPKDKVTPTPRELTLLRVPHSRTPTGPNTQPQVPTAQKETPSLPKTFRSGYRITTPSTPQIPRPLSKFERYPHLLRFSRLLRSVLLKVKPDAPEAPPKIEHYPHLLRMGRLLRSVLLKVKPETIEASPKIEHYPHLLRMGRLLRSVLLKVEPDKPIRMPSFPALGFPSLYTRYSIMKTYTAVTDANGRVTVTFPRVFRKIPGVVLTPQADVTWFPVVLSKNEFGFTTRILKTAHEHQHPNSGGSGGHDHTHPNSGGSGGHWHTIESAGGHSHSVGGTISLNLHRTLAYTSLAVIGVPNHFHPNPTTSAPSYDTGVVTGIHYGDDCPISGKCVTGFDYSTAAGAGHTHTQGNTDCAGGHTHTLSAGSNNFVYDADIDIVAWTTSTDGTHPHGESTEPNHEHTVPNSNTEPNHEHTVPDSNEKQASLLANTSVTFTYFAQEEV